MTFCHQNMKSKKIGNDLIRNLNNRIPCPTFKTKGTIESHVPPSKPKNNRIPCPTLKTKGQEVHRQVHMKDTISKPSKTGGHSAILIENSSNIYF